MKAARHSTRLGTLALGITAFAVALFFVFVHLPKMWRTRKRMTRLSGIGLVAAWLMLKVARKSEVT